mmetsp:Transcript_61598/g.144395  ORF Transcript_61598/g.144395 Transcript_61598/m.144395 type:complete len:253 (-) Transcript_61598:734-1492(-)
MRRALQTHILRLVLRPICPHLNGQWTLSVGKGMSQPPLLHLRTLGVPLSRGRSSLKRGLAIALALCWLRRVGRIRLRSIWNGRGWRLRLRLCWSDWMRSFGRTLEGVRVSQRPFHMRFADALCILLLLLRASHTLTTWPFQSGWFALCCRWNLHSKWRRHRAVTFAFAFARLRPWVGSIIPRICLMSREWFGRLRRRLHLCLRYRLRWPLAIWLLRRSRHLRLRRPAVCLPRVAVVPWICFTLDWGSGRLRR